MADVTTTHGAPGIAAFARETYGNIAELRLQDTPALAFRKVRITATGGDLALPIYSVIGPTGLAAYQAVLANKTVVGITAHPINLLEDAFLDIEVICAGNLDINALTWASTFDTNAKKLSAFDGLGSPINMILGINPFNSDGVLA